MLQHATLANEAIVGIRLPQVPPLVELNRTLSSLILPHWPHYVKTSHYPQNRKYTTHCIVVTATGTENFVMYGLEVFSHTTLC